MKRPTLLFFAVSLCAVAAGPSAETLKQVLTSKMLKLLPSGFTERQVLYQAVQPGNGMNTFNVTAIIRDYGPGYPPNRYYGTTCVSRFDATPFTLMPDGRGGWDVQGALTPPIETHQCKPNPAQG